VTTLVVAAHPDDEVLGCGGTIARIARTGESVHIAILGEGSTARAEQRAEADRSAISELDDAARRAGDTLGASGVSLHGLPDNRFDTVDLLDLAKLVERLIDEVSPDTVYCQHGGDLNVDHQRTFQAVLTATRPVPGHPVRNVYAFEVRSSTDWAFAQFAPAFRATRFVDISTTIDSKVRALEAYNTEMRPFPHTRSTEAVRALAQTRGATVGVAAAEAFAVVRELC
jgi:LmbE family N-acetylglucosaminyl deacetylase